MIRWRLDMKKWLCECGNDENDGNFCYKCGKKRPEQMEDTISNNTFWCNNCGSRLIVNSTSGKDLKCSKCGFEANYYDIDYINTSTPTLARLNIENIPDLRIGEEFSFGRIAEYQLKWTVLDSSEEKIQAICQSYRYLDNLPYNEELVKSTWKSCSLRRFLNEEFIYAAFSQEERSRIINTNLDNENNSLFGTNGGDQTEDKVYILSENEASRLITDDCGKKRKWWLRTPGYSSFSASFFSDSVDVIGEQVNKHGIVGYPSVRPVIWIDTSGIPRYKRESTEEIKSDFIKGNEIEFGFDSRRGPMKWIILDVKDNHALIITKDIFRERLFDKKQDDDYNYIPLWEKSIIRKWLNEDFLNNHMTTEEKNRILVIDNPNNNVKKYDDSIVEGHITKDKVFLLSDEEAKSYFVEDNERCCEGCPWMLRTTDAYFVKCVDHKGELGKISCGPDDYTGIRPAMWIVCS